MRLLPFYLIAVFLALGPRSCNSLSEEVFNAEISGMPCSILLVTKNMGKKVVKKKSMVQCITDKQVPVLSALVMNDNTGHIFNLTLVAGVKKTKLKKAEPLPEPTDLNMAAKSIQHQGPTDEHVDEDLVKMFNWMADNSTLNLTTNNHGFSVRCTYQQPENVSWNSNKENGRCFKVLQLLDESRPGACLKYSFMSALCEEVNERRNTTEPSTNNDLTPATEKKESPNYFDDKSNGFIVAGYQVDIPNIQNISMNFSEYLSSNSIGMELLEEVEGDDDKGQKTAVPNKWPATQPATYPVSYTVKYELDIGSVSDRMFIRSTLNLLRAKLGQCIRFEESNAWGRVKVVGHGGCSSYKGYIGWGTQTLRLGPGCMHSGIIVHEFLHAIGLSHEQTRSDRNSYVVYFKNNVCCNMEHNFKICSNCNHYGQAYDYSSVMHYGRNSFSNGNGDTLRPVAANSWALNKIGQRDGISLGDIQMVQRHYNCPVVIQWKGIWGAFPSHPRFCPAGSFVYGYRLRSEPPQGGGDDTALNDIELYCQKPNVPASTWYTKIWSAYNGWGTFSSPVYCSGLDNPVVGFDVKEEGQQGGGDDTTLNDIDLYCRSGPYISANVNTYWGSWKPKQMCPSGYAVMGIRTRVEEPQGGGDDTSLNGLELYCAPYPN